jgi:hypothetical protein
MGSFPTFLLVGAMWFLPSPLSLSVYPAFGMAPATFRFLVIVPRDARNRQLCYGYSGSEDRKSCVQLDGDQARRTYTAYWSLRTAGEYQAVATVTRNEGGQIKSYVETQPFRVLGVEP